MDFWLAFLFRKNLFSLLFKSIKRLPFDWRNPKGFLLANFVQFILVTAVMITIKCLAIFGLGTCSMLFPLTKDMKNILKTIDDHAQRRKNQSKIGKQFSRIVRFHCKLIQLSFDVFRVVQCDFINY